MMKQLIFSLLALLPVCALAQVPVEEPGLSTPTFISPRYFGPYTFPVPDQLESKVKDKLFIELSGDAVIGHLAGQNNKDYTYAPTFKAVVPLFTDRVNLSLWGEFHEFYTDTPATREMRRVDAKYALKGHDAGSLYLSTDILLLREGKYYPSVVVRAATLTATGDDYEKARHYDAPGYFFDGSIGKSFTFADASYLRLSASAGFLCWQTDRGRQNDATMLGAALSYNHSIFSLLAEYGQYKGWENCGDFPKTVKARLTFHVGRFEPFFYYAHGINDWPFDQFRAGLAVNFDILKKK